MALLTISAAARLCHCDRRTLQRAIHAGRLHLDADHGLSREELIATGYLIPDVPQAAPQEAPHHTPQETPQIAALLPLLERLASAIEALRLEIQRLREHQPPTPQAAPQGTPQETPQAMPQATPQETPQEHYGRPGLSQATLQAMAAERTRHPDLTLRAFAQHLFDQGIYRGRSRTGAPIPADHTRLRRWLQQARQQA